MANRPHPDRRTVGWRLHRDLVDRVTAEAKARGEAVPALVTRALLRELDDPTEPAQTEGASWALPG